MHPGNFSRRCLPYKFKLLRGSRDGFTPKKFHELCDNVPCTVTFIKVKGTEEILGGYNPLMWESHGGISSKCVGSNDSFIFSFKNKDDFKDQILSNIKNVKYAFYYHKYRNPSFGNSDLYLHVNPNSKNYSRCYCRLDDYEKMIRNTNKNFSMKYFKF